MAWKTHVGSEADRLEFSYHVKDYEADIAAHPDDAIAHMNLGNAYAELGRNTDAFNQYKLSIQLDPTNARVYHRLGLLYYYVEDYRSAVQCYLTAVKYKPDFQSAWYELGITYREMEDYKAEIAAMRKASDLGPFDMMPLIEIGDAYCYLHDKPNAVKAYVQHLWIYPTDTRIRNCACLILLELHRTPEATTLAANGLKLATSTYDKTYMQATVADCRRDYARAIPLYLACHKMKPDEWGPYNNYSNDLYATGHHEQARAIWRSLAAGTDTDRADWARCQLETHK
jgi:tetratricopeptide (TPR) repeat protein